MFKFSLPCNFFKRSHSSLAISVKGSEIGKIANIPFICLFERLCKNFKYETKYKFRTRLRLELSYRKSFVLVKYDS